MIAIRPAPYANKFSNLFLMEVVGIVRISLWQSGLLCVTADAGVPYSA
jgi:hypothetical protein